MASLIDKYRATQRRLRRRFDPYTAKLCPVCPEPCCRKPTKVADFDLLLVATCGYALPSHDAPGDFVRACADILAGTQTDTPIEPCDYLGRDGCVFPDDLRPFECARYICSLLKKEISPGDMREIRRLLRRLSDQRRQIVDAATPRNRRQP